MEITSNKVDRLEAAFTGADDANLFVQLADAYREAGEHERALGILRKGLEKHASFVTGFVMLGRILLEQKRYQEALVTFERVLEIEPANAAARDALNEIIAALKASSPGAAAPSAQAVAPAEDVMPWDDPTPTSERRSQTHSELAAPPEPTAEEATAALFDDSAFAMIPQDEESQDTTGIVRANEIIQTAGQLDSMAVGLADLLVGLLEYRDPFFRGGTSQTRLLATAIAKELGMNAEEVQAIALGTVLRDLGQVPLKGLLSKPGTELGDEGRRRMENHVETALELLASVNLPPMVRDVIRHHHERWDGNGYPDGLVGEAIPLAARIVAVADSFAAMISARPHRLPRRVPAALDDI
ncbi:MAG TPA: HD domain-containing phosphohydrolase, partial [Longimicrobiales bacterium]|nr:HD domain-containing phosphohydrolase [Longimicrobiales bacterium]